MTSGTIQGSIGMATVSWLQFRVRHYTSHDCHKGLHIGNIARICVSVNFYHLFCAK